MGVPVVTFPGATFAGRHATSHLSNAGCEVFIGHDVAEYIRLAVEWSRRVDELAALRAVLREKIRQSPLCDAERFAGDFVNILAAACKRA
jgi:predicted O-linked N-acetylglucosamine transferase (SPINDLY family)